MDSKIIKDDFKDLDKFVRGFKDNKYVVKVGILGDKDVRSNGSNASIGAVHEFGSISQKIPARSFLRMPLIFKSQEIISMTSKASEKAIAKGNMKQMFKNLGIACENVVQQAFTSAGFGQWRPLKHRSGSPLVDTGQLRRAIISKVEEAK